MTATAYDVLGYAAKFIGTVGGDRYWEVVKPAWKGAPYCAAFVQFVLGRFGMEYDATLPFYVPSLEQKARNEGRWHSKNATPKPGWLVIYGGSSAQHVGFLERPLSGGLIQTIEANTSSGNTGSQANGNGTYRRVRSRSWVRGFIDTTDIYPTGSPSTGGRLLSEDGIGDEGTWKVIQKWVGVERDGIPGPITLGGLQVRAGRPRTGVWTQADTAALAKVVGAPELADRPWSWNYRTKPTRLTLAIEQYLNRAIRRGRFTA